MSHGQGTSTCQQSVLKVYKSVIEDVISNVREAFLDDGVDEQVLQELKTLWETRLTASKALENAPPPSETQAKQSSQTQSTVVHPQFLQLSNANVALWPYPQQSSIIQTAPSRQQATVPLTVIRGPSNVHSQSQQPQQLAFVQGAPHFVRIAQNVSTIVNAPGTTTNAANTITLDQIRSGYAVSKFEAHNRNLPQLDGNADLLLESNNEEGSEPSSSKALKSKSGRNVAIALKPAATQKQKSVPKQIILQLDGGNVSDDSDEFEDSDDEIIDPVEPDAHDEDDDDLADEKEAEDAAEEGEPLGPEDDISDEEDPEDMFDAENVVVCQYEKINRTKNKWKLVLKDGIMNLNGKDYVFQKATGEAEW